MPSLNKFRSKFTIMVLTLTTAYGTLYGQCPIPYCYGCMQEWDGICHLFYGVQGLYWTVSETDLNFAVDVNSTDIEAILGKGRSHFLEYDWNGGVRGWMGWNWCLGWDLRLIYTYYKNEETSKAAGNDDTVLEASLFHPESFEGIADRARGVLHLEYQTADAFFGKVLTFCHNALVFHPFFGARGLKLDQRLHVCYEGSDFDTKGEVIWDSSIKAAGLHAGANMEKRWCCGAGIFGSIGASLLAANSKNHHRQFVEMANEDEEEEEEEDGFSRQIDLKDERCTCLPGLHVSGGVNWDFCSNECFFLKVKLGYEFNHWMNVPQIPRYHLGNKGVRSDGNSGQLCLHGATLSLEIYF